MPVEVARVYLVFPHDCIFIGPLYPADTHTHTSKVELIILKRKKNVYFMWAVNSETQTIKIVELVSLKS